MAKQPVVNTEQQPLKQSRPRSATRWILGLFLLFAGTAHLTFAREEFVAQVPDFVPLDTDTTVLASGVAELSLGALLLIAKKKRGMVGVLVALFFIAIFPGNLSQWINQVDAFGLDTDNKRFVRLFFQPVLVWLAWWSTGPRK